MIILPVLRNALQDTAYILIPQCLHNYCNMWFMHNHQPTSRGIRFGLVLMSVGMAGLMEELAGGE